MDLKYYKLYCKNFENIENFEKAKKDNFKGWEVHHRLETHNSDGERRLVDITKTELKALDMYYNRPAEELIFLTAKEHKQLHTRGKSNPNFGKQHSSETRKKISKGNKGKYLSEDTKNKISKANKGRTPWNKGKHCSSEQKIKQSEAIKGRHWYNNGKENKFCYECPEGFVAGKLLIK